VSAVAGGPRWLLDRQDARDQRYASRVDIVDADGALLKKEFAVSLE